MFPLILWLFWSLLASSESLKYAPLTSISTRKSNISQFLRRSDFKNIISSPNNSIFVGVSYTVDCKVLIQVQLSYLLISSTSQKPQGWQTIEFDEQLPVKYLKVVWLDPDKILFFFEDEDYTLMGAKVAFGQTTTAQKIDRPKGLKLILSGSYIDWQNKSLSAFYALAVFQQQYLSNLKVFAAKITISNNFTFSIIGTQQIQQISKVQLQPQYFKLKDYYCLRYINVAQNRSICCFNIINNTQSKAEGLIDLKSDQRIMRFQPMQNQLSILVVVLSKQKNQYRLNAIYYLLFFEENDKINFTRVEKLNFEIGLQGQDQFHKTIFLPILNLPQLSNTIAIIYYDQSNQKYQIYLYQVAESKVKFYQYAEIKGYTLNEFIRILYLGDIKAIALLFENRVLFMQNKTNQDIDIKQVLILFMVVLFSVFLIVFIQTFRNIFFTKFTVLIHLRKNNIFTRMALIILAYSLVFFLSLSINTNIINFKELKYRFKSYQQKDDEYLLGTASKTVGSQFMQIFNILFTFQLVVMIIFEIKDEAQYGLYYLEYHIKNGLKTFVYISHRIVIIIAKSILHSTAFIMFIYLLQTVYSDPFYAIFSLDQKLIALTIGIIFDIISSLMIGIIITQLFVNLPISIYVSIIFILQYYFSYLNSSTKITNIEYFFTMIFPPFSGLSLFASLYRVDIHYIENSISPLLIISASFKKCILSLFFYTFIVWRKIYRKRFEELVKQNIPKQKDSILINRSQIKNHSEEGISIQPLQQYESTKLEPILSVFIPQKMNLKNRLEKNKVLNNIRFTAQMGTIISFIDTQHQSKNVLMKILINEEKSDPIINMRLFGQVTYRQKLSISYCYEKDIYFPELTLKEHLLFYHSLKKSKANKSEREVQIINIMDEFNIPEDFQNKKAKHLSGGYLKKMCLACTFIGDPSLVILQEPTVGLDLRFQRIFWNKLKEWKQNKLIIIFTSNDNEAQAISDKIWYFQKAKIYNFYQLKNRNKKMSLALQFLNNQGYNKFRQITNQYALQMKASYTKIAYHNNNSVPSICITSFIIQQRTQFSYFQQLLFQLQKTNKQQFQFHFRFEIIDYLLQPSQLAKKFKNFSCNYCDREKLLEFMLQESDNYKNDQQYDFLSQNQQHKTSILRILQQLTILIDNLSWHIIFSQISSVLLRRWYIYKNHLLMKLLISQNIIFIFAFIIFQEETGHYTFDIQYSNQFMIKITLYFLLYSFVSSNIAFQTEKYLGYYETIGLNIKLYWMGSFVMDILFSYIPFLFSILIVKSAFLFFEFNTQFRWFSQIGYSLLYSIGYNLTSLIIKQFHIDQSIYLSIVVTIFTLPIYILESTYLSYYQLNTTIIQYFSYFFYPLSIKYAYQFQQVTKYLFAMMIQFISLFMCLFLFEKVKRKSIKERNLYFQSNQNINNQFISQEREFIDEIDEEKNYMIGENLMKVYGNSFALRNVYFHVKLGQILGVFGHNSSGKTSLFNIIAGSLNLTSGKIKYFGKEKSTLSWRDKLNIGYCPQIDNLDSNLTYEQNARVIGRMKGLTHEQINKHIKELGKYLHFEGNEQVRLCDLSISERKKSNFIIALLGLPKIFMMDQTSTGVDQTCSSLFLELLRAYSSQLNKAVILTSHNVKEGQKYCDRVMILKNGILKAAGKPFDLKMGLSFQLYKMILCFSRDQSLVLRSKKKQKMKSFLENVHFKKIIFEDEYRIYYGFDMHKGKISEMLQLLLSCYNDGTIQQFSFYKYDLEEVSQYYINQEEEK